MSGVRDKRWPVMLVLAAVAVLAYWPALQAGWIWDDDSYVTANMVIQSPDGIWRAWIPGETPQYYPLVFVSFWLQHAAHGLQPMWFHLVNVLLHVVSALLLWRLLERLEVRGAVLAAAIFALHPVQVESVAWVTERKNVLSMCFALLSVLAWLRWSQPTELRRGSGWWLSASFGLFLAAMLSKTTAAAVPVALLAIEWWKGPRLRAAVLAVAPFLVTGVSLGLFTARMEIEKVGAVGEEFERTAVERLAQASQAAWFYPYTWVWPADLMFVYPRFSQGPDGWIPWLAFAGALACGVVAVLLARRGARGPAALLAVYAAGIFPALGFLNVYPLRYAPVADHFGYVAGVAVCVGGAWLLATGWKSLASRAIASTPRVAWLGVTAMVVLLSTLWVLTWTQCLPYRDEVALWTWSIERNPHAFLAATNLASHELRNAQAALDAGDDAAFAAALQRADELATRAAGDSGGSDMPALANLAEVRRLQGRLEEALQLAVRATAKSNYPAVIWQRGRLYELTGDWSAAGRDYEWAARSDPPNPQFMRDWVRWLMGSQRLEEATREAGIMSMRLPDHARTRAEYANLLLETGQVVAARAQYRQVLRRAEPELQQMIAVRLVDAYLRAPTDPSFVAEGLQHAGELVRLTSRAEPIPLLLLARAQALSKDPLRARESLEHAEKRLESSTPELRQAAAPYLQRALEALGAPAAPNL